MVRNGFRWRSLDLRCLFNVFHSLILRPNLLLPKIVVQTLLCQESLVIASLGYSYGPRQVNFLLDSEAAYCRLSRPRLDLNT